MDTICQTTDTTAMSKQRMWERKLLDLSLRNTLLSFRLTKSALQLMCPDLTLIEDSLAKGETYRILPRPSDWEDSAQKIHHESNIEFAAEELKNRRLRSYLDERALESSIKTIHRQAKVSLEENGANTLYLALGFLRWYESDTSERERYAPIILVPVELVRRLHSKEYTLRPRDEESRINVTLLEMLRQDFGINIEGLDPLPMDSSGVDLKTVFSIIREAVREQKRWDIEEMTFLGLFSFSQFIMWNDIHCRSEELAQNKVVKSLITGKLSWEPKRNLLTAQELDEKLPPSSMAVPMSADASQMTAIYAASAGQSFVLHGPPGTGKSQTITNMIANALYQGKSVLFVAEKMAALNVVQKRLASIGLDPFCLELHSNKARKKDVLDQLEKTLEVGRIKSPEEYESAAEQLHSVRNELNSFVWQLHLKRNYGMSLYDAISIYEKNIEHDGKLKLGFTKRFIEQMTDNSIPSWRTSLSKYKVAATECASNGMPVMDHPLRLFQSREYSYALQNELEKEIGKLHQAAADLETLTYNVMRLFMMHTDGSFESILRYKNLAEAYLVCKNYPECIMTNSEILMLKKKVYRTMEIIGEIKDLEDELLSSFDENVFTYEVRNADLKWKTAEQSWIIKKKLEQSKLIKELRVFSKKPENITAESITDFYEKLQLRIKLHNELKDHELDMKHLFGALWDGVNSQCETMLDMYENTSDLRNLIADMVDGSEYVEIALNSMASIRENGNQTIEDFIECVDYISSHLDSMCSKYKIALDRTEKRKSWCSYICSSADSWIAALSSLKDWTNYLLSCDEMKNSGIGAVVTAVEGGKISCDDIIPAFECAVSKECAMYTISESAELRTFRGAQFNDTIRRYGDMVSNFEKLTIYELVAKLSAKIPASGTINASSSEIGILRRTIKSGGRMMSIRRLFDSIPSMLRRICPCMLMSPISVAQYIDPSFPKFDLVIFDEASQLPASEAVGAIARGENVIIVGDPNQLPPTTFFASSHMSEDDEDTDIQDLESLLDDCLALSMPQDHLKWHYRSRHESLIAYSNMHYYDNKLYTFPSPNDMESMVRLIHVDGIYDRGGTKQNQAEAEAVVAEIVRRYKNESLRNDSIGVVTFNSLQQNLIDDLIIEAFHNDPELEDINNSHSEPLFIKNLENVQGDERDVILFSVGYGPDKSGKVTMNFGPLNREGGWRRLNVAISRARKEMTVFSSLRPEDIDLSKTASAGISGLKGFLEFAQRGKNAVAAKASAMNSSDHGLEETIAEKLREKGFNVRCGVGCSEYKIDIGIVDDNDPTKYILGIICDGIVYKNSDTARDRNILQPSVLTSLGWKLHRVWSLDWLDNPERELNKIIAAVGHAKHDRTMPASEEKKTVKEELKFEKSEETELKNMRVYITASRESSFLRRTTEQPNDFYLADTEKDILRYIKYVLEIEAPISRDLLCKRVTSAWGIQRVGPKAEELIDRLVAQTDAYTIDHGDNAFIWGRDMSPVVYNQYRIPETDDTKRAITDICPEEMANAIKDILSDQISMSKEDLIRETARVFGYVRLGSQIEQSVEHGIDTACMRGFALMTEDGKISCV